MRSRAPQLAGSICHCVTALVNKLDRACGELGKRLEAINPPSDCKHSVTHWPVNSARCSPPGRDVLTCQLH
ncbi:unnamed protein product [Protopolystoma xenopodis]|uniref:Uncharacterized protein n=1 Tax=Protopolystoma xenopodis TaxID=117903 RepID=A0A3S5B597_9PLAT|nr:unnamed protein product [Protopolystoma xenopodis]